mmetsp:Transcript_45099/g.109120  ORF Transcript_45099/g.109120 Transcript_45099/m.109120 type:complete len:143 (+) Transcript_45099:119-547(+)|eukprot:CAMPEP_0113630586 /NCGR_PEP_ID=MMETSP0017_2-20120614/15892_1 /TAXON_ID=2856 /ORGANISM="Cylindrotheca closterium" /LENGTH=142 /DNA_ID=CAMNT_0000541057 /DNA_START=84 /DNA_END=512 /DNA_ORIENTATION=+ /assembly_acc=CAM_ASM_000147
MSESSCIDNSGYSELSDRSDMSERSSVSFGTIEFHEHAIVLGDNPSTSCGPSLEIDWNVQHNVTIDVDDYESHRMPRRSKDQLIMPNAMRTDMLLTQGYSLREIRETSAKRKERRSSIGNGIGKSILPKKLSKLLPTRRSSK